MSFYSEEIAKKIYEKRDGDIDYHIILMVVEDALHLYQMETVKSRHREVKMRGFER